MSALGSLYIKLGEPDGELCGCTCEVGDWAAVYIADLIQQRDKLLAALESLLLITADSKGVAGYHLNGAVANWDEFPEVNEAALLVTQLKGQS